MGRVRLALLMLWLPAVSGSVAAQTLVPVGAPQLVVPFENTTHDPRGYWLAEGSAVLLTDDLIALGAQAIRREDRLTAFDRLHVPPIASLSHATVIRLGQVVGAAQVVIGSFELKDEQVTVHARAIRLDNGRLFPDIAESGPLSDLFAIFGRVAKRLLPDSRVTTEQMERDHPTLPAFEQYIKGVLAENPATQVSFLSQAIQLAPAFQRPRLALWQVHTDQGEHAQALAIVRGVPANHPQSRSAQFLAAVSLISLGQYQQAFDTLTLLNNARTDAALLNNLGITQLRRTATATGSRATTYLREATQADPNDPDLFFNLGYAAWFERDTPAAVAALREAVRRNPADDAAHYALGVALQSTGSSAEGAREKELAKQLSSTHAEWEAKQPNGNSIPRGWERIKMAVDVTLRLEDVIVAAGQRDQRELAQFHLEAGRRLAQAERDVEAIAELRRAVYLAPYDSQAHLLLGRIYFRSSRAADAINSLKIAIWADPNNAEAKQLLAQITPP
jgi:tetratricopeptide (TPR) repeat protein/TolB-like protein